MKLFFVVICIQINKKIYFVYESLYDFNIVVYISEAIKFMVLWIGGLCNRFVILSTYKTENVDILTKNAITISQCIIYKQ